MVTIRTGYWYHWLRTLWHWTLCRKRTRTLQDAKSQSVFVVLADQCLRGNERKAESHVCGSL